MTWFFVNFVGITKSNKLKISSIASSFYLLMTKTRMTPGHLLILRKHRMDWTHWGRERNGRHFPDDFWNAFFVNENISISITISLKYISKGSINNILALFLIMAWRRSGDKPLSEPTMASFLTHISVSKPQCVIYSIYHIKPSVSFHYTVGVYS